MPRFEDLATEGQALVEVGGAVVGVDVATQAELDAEAAARAAADRRELYVPGVAEPAVVSATWGRANFSQVYGVTGYSSSSIDQYAEWQLPMTAGTWRLDGFVLQTTDSGIITASVDGVDLAGTVDLYASSTGLRLIAWTGIVVSTTGTHNLRLRSNSKNASSSGYRLYVRDFTLSRTA